MPIPLKRYFENISWLMLEKVITMPVSLIVGLYVARYLGPENFGALSYALSFVGMFLAIATLGLDNIVVRELVKHVKTADEILGTAFLLKIAGFVLMWIAVLIAIFLTDNDLDTNMLILIVASGVVFQASNVIIYHYQAVVQSKYVVLARIIPLTVSSVAKIVLIYFSSSLEWFAWVYLLDAMVLSASLIAVYSLQSGGIFKWRWSLGVAKKLLRDSWPLMVALGCYYLYQKIDQVMIGEMIGMQEVGYYSASSRLYEAIIGVSLLLVGTFKPKLISDYMGSKRMFWRTCESLLLAEVLIGYVVFLMAFFFSEEIINALYGVEFSSSAPIFIVHTISVVLMMGAAVRSGYIEIINKTQIIMITTFVALVLNVVLNYFLIGMYGSIGAAVATVITQLFALYLLGYYFVDMRRITKLQFEALLVIPLIARRFFNNAG